MKKTTLVLRVLLVPLDYMAIFFAGLSAYFLRFDSSLTDFRPVFYEMSFRAWLLIMLLVAVFAVVVFFIGGLYSMRPSKRFITEMVKIFYACSTVVLGVIVLIFFQRELFSSRFIILAAWGLAVVYVIVAHGVMRIIELLLLRKNIGVNRLVVVGEGGDAEGLLSFFYHSKTSGYIIVGRLRALQDNYLEALRALVKEKNVDTVLQADPALDRDAVLRLQSFCDERHIDFLYAPDRFAQHRANIEMLDIGGYPLIEVKRTSLEGWGSIAKRIFDIVVASFLIILLSPVFVVIAIAIALDSRGPIFFSRLDDGSPLQRIGKHNVPFRYLKFRTMQPNVHSLKNTPELQQRNLRTDGPLTKIKDDPRVTRIGKTLRRYSLDELPEFFLVLRGTMSLVGPRPHEPEEVERYTREQRKVLRIKPGVTGMAQVSGRSELSFDEEMHLDLFYVERWSIALDMQILLRTPLAVFKRRNAE